ERAVGAAGSVYRAADGERKNLFAAADAASRPAREEPGRRGDPGGDALARDVRRRARRACRLPASARVVGAARESKRQRRRRVQGAGRFPRARPGRRRWTWWSRWWRRRWWSWPGRRCRDRFALTAQRERRAARRR